MAQPIKAGDQAGADRNLYSRDFHAWTKEQARLLRARRFEALDLDNLAEEVEAVGRSERREIENRLRVLVAHLLKWRYQPGARSAGWRGTIAEQRARLSRVLADSPSLRSFPSEAFDLAYLSGRLLAAKETGMDFALFPETPPFTLEQVLDEAFLPVEPGLIDPP